MGTLGALEAPTPALCHIRERERERWKMGFRGVRLRVLGGMETCRCWQMLQQEPWSWLGQGRRQIPFFASKALLRVSFPVNVTGPYGSIGNTCVNIPQVPVQKVNGGNTDSVHWKGRTEEVVRGRKVQSWSPFCTVIS